MPPHKRRQLRQAIKPLTRPKNKSDENRRLQGGGFFIAVGYNSGKRNLRCINLVLRIYVEPALKT